MGRISIKLPVSHINDRDLKKLIGNGHGLRGEATTIEKQLRVVDSVTVYFSSIWIDGNESTAIDVYEYVTTQVWLLICWCNCSMEPHGDTTTIT